VHLREIHLCIVRHRAWRRTIPVFLKQTELRRFAFILTDRWGVDLGVTGIKPECVDARETDR
jgi:hypothetical protein